MTLRQFIAANRDELDDIIARALKMDHNPRPDDDERRLWILNDEGLYHWARSEGVKI
jgi:hypothetical protein